LRESSGAASTPVGFSAGFGLAYAWCACFGFAGTLPGAWTDGRGATLTAIGVAAAGRFRPLT
jgi:hypothetical protein